MRDRFGGADAGRAVAAATRRTRRIRADLERRGVEPALSQSMAARLAPLTQTLSARAYGAALDAAVAAVDVTRVDDDVAGDRSRDVAEIHRLMLGFTEELRKLEEGLRILSTFVVRMRTRAGVEGGGVLH
jgi:hypothetical protein